MTPRVRGAALLVFAWLAAPANAAEIERVRADMEAALARFDERVLGIVDHGPLQVRAEGDVYRVIVPDLGVGGPAGLRFGTLEFALDPLDEDRYEVSDLKLPSRTVIDVPDGTVTIDLPSQSFTGVFSKAIEDFLSLDASFGSIRLGHDNGEYVRIGAATMLITSQEKNPGVFDMHSRYAIEDLFASLADAGLAIGTIAFSTELRDYPAVEVLRATEALEAWVPEMGSAGQPAAGNAAEALASLRALFASLPSGSGALVVRNLRHDPVGPKVYSLGELGVEFGNEIPKPGEMEIRLRLYHSELEFADPTLYEKLLPRAASIDLRLEKLPLQVLLDIFSSVWLAQAGASGSEAEKQDGVIGPEALQTMTEAGTRLRLVDSFVETPVARADLQGALTANAGAVHQMFGEAAVELRGLDALIDGVTALADADERARGAVAMLELMRGYAIRETLPGGGVRDLYHVSLVPTGQVLVNGKELTGVGAGP